jgi:hypothetical protein
MSKKKKKKKRFLLQWQYQEYFATGTVNGNGNHNNESEDPGGFPEREKEEEGGEEKSLKNHVASKPRGLFCGLFGWLFFYFYLFIVLCYFIRGVQDVFVLHALAPERDSDVCEKWVVAYSFISVSLQIVFCFFVALIWLWRLSALSIRKTVVLRSWCHGVVVVVAAAAVLS